jgi:hypothetical protein
VVQLKNILVERVITALWNVQNEKIVQVVVNMCKDKKIIPDWDLTCSLDRAKNKFPLLLQPILYNLVE